MSRTLYLVFLYIVFNIFNGSSCTVNLATSFLPVTIAGLTASISIRRWTDAETAIAVYFVFRNTDYKACVKIIFYKTEKENLESQTSLNIRNKFYDIRITEDL